MNDLALPAAQMAHESWFDFERIRADLDARINYSEGHVYVIERPDGLVKIGRTASPDKRMRAISTLGGFEPKQAWLSDRLKHAAFVEKACHASLGSYRVIGEWFECSFNLAVTTARYASLFEDQIRRILKRLAGEPGPLLQQAMDAADGLCSMIHDNLSHISDEDFAAVARATLAPELNRIASDLSACASRIRNAAEQIGTANDEATA